MALVRLPFGKVLHEPAVELDSVYFPTTAIVSLQYELADGACTELAVVGNEGMVDIALFMGGDTTSSRAIVDSPGNAFRLKAMILKDEFYRCNATRDRLLRYTQALITQMAQNAVCNRHHSVDQQICRWMAGRLDRQHSSELIVTQELIAAKLGVRRESVTAAAISLQKAGLIRCHRGHILVVDRAGLEERCCECYAVVKLEMHRLLQIPTRFTDAAARKSSVRPGAYPHSDSHQHTGFAT
jgi:CRP-like cAMP-binding protein